MGYWSYINQTLQRSEFWVIQPAVRSYNEVQEKCTCPAFEFKAYPTGLIHLMYEEENKCSVRLWLCHDFVDVVTKNGNY